MLIPYDVHADMGPKPSVNISFSGIEGTFYVTLISPNELYGPWSVYDDENGSQYYNNDNKEIFMKFVEYKDPDGYHFLQYMEKCSEDNAFSWTYYAPETFKVLIYLVDSDEFICTASYDKYAFDSYYKYDFKTNTLIENYNYTWEIISLIIRVILTIAIEIVVALLFGVFKNNKKTIIITNIITQLILNIAVNIINYSAGMLAVVFLIMPIELVVMIIESIVYRKKFVEKKRAIWYAIFANSVSLVLGLYLAALIPAVF